MEDEANQAALRVLWELATELDGRSPGALIKARWFHSAKEVLLPNATLGTYRRDPALLYAFSREAFRRYFRDTLLFSEALQEVCRRKGYKFDVTDKKAWAKIHANPKLLAAARHLLDRDMDFVFSVLESVAVRTDFYMSYITDASVQRAIEVGIEQLLARVKETPIDAIRHIRGEKPRSSDEKNQSVVNIANRFAGTIIPDATKQRRPKKKGWAFNYLQLCEVVCKLGDENGPPPIRRVQERLGCSNLNRTLESNKELLKIAYGHSSHLWRALSEEIWDRCGGKF